MSSFHKMFVYKMVRELVEQKIPQYTEFCEVSDSGKKFVVSDPSGTLLADIRNDLAMRAEMMRVPTERFEEYFEQDVLPAYHQVIPKIFARI